MATTAPSHARLATIAHALSDETRLNILGQLRHGERCVCDLTAELDAAQSRLSFHLRVLREAGLVIDRREGRWMFYRISSQALDDLEGAVAALRPGALPLGGGEGCCV